MYDLHKRRHDVGAIQGAARGHRYFTEENTPADGVGEEAAISFRRKDLAGVCVVSHPQVIRGVVSREPVPEYRTVDPQHWATVHNIQPATSSPEAGLLQPRR